MRVESRGSLHPLVWISSEKRSFWRRQLQNISDRREKDDDVDNVTAVLERAAVLLAASIDNATVTGELTKMKRQTKTTGVLEFTVVNELSMAGASNNG